MQRVQRHRPRQGQKMMEYTNSQIIAIIDEVIHSERDRQILKRRMVDGIYFEQLAEEFDLSTQRIKAIVYKAQKKIIKYL